MFKAPIYKHDEGHILLTTSARINRLAEVAKLYGHKMELVQCVNATLGQHDFARFSWTDFLRDAYLALGRLPDDDVEAHHIKNMLTKATDMFQGVIPFHALEYSVTMGIVKKLEDWEADVLSGKTDVDATLKSDDPAVNKVFKEGYNPVVTGANLAEQITSYFGKTENPLRLKFRMDISRELGIVPMQELRRALASLPFDITLTTPTERTTMFDKVPKLNGMMINVIPADEMTDYCRFRLQYTFDKHIDDQVARDLIKERMQERKIGGSVSWQIDSLVITATCAEQDTLVEAIQWRCKVEEELLEVLASMTSNDNKFIR